MFSLIFGVTLLAIALVFRDYAQQDEAANDLESANENGFIAFACVVLAAIFIATGIGGF